jgi:hypothetical protein
VVELKRQEENVKGRGSGCLTANNLSNTRMKDTQGPGSSYVEVEGYWLRSKNRGGATVAHHNPERLEMV